MSDVVSSTVGGPRTVASTPRHASWSILSSINHSSAPAVDYQFHLFQPATAEHKLHTQVIHLRQAIEPGIRLS